VLADGRGLIVVDVEGGRAARVRGTRRFDRDPAWSRRGEIAFARPRGQNGGEVWLVRAGAGARLPRLLLEAALEPVWSPDGNFIAYTNPWPSHAPYGIDVWTARRDGTRRRRLTSRGDFNSAPVWSPDGRWIAFISNRLYDPPFESAEGRMFVMRADGRGERLITRGAEASGPIDWRPLAG
jgi:TolB protein